MLNEQRYGLRLIELEIGLATNVDEHSPGMVDYEISRTVGQAARLAMFVRGLDVIEDEQRLKKIAALELRISGPAYTAAKRVLQEVDLFQEKTVLGKKVIHEKVQRLDHVSNYERLGAFWVSKTDRTENEKSLVDTLDAVIEAPVPIASIPALDNLGVEERNAVIEVGTNSCLLDKINDYLFCPLLWEMDFEKTSRFLERHDNGFANIVAPFKEQPGLDLATFNSSPTILQAVSCGLIPSYRVSSTAGERVYGFSPYAGRLLVDNNQRSILDKARSIVACIRYGNEAATITKIRNPGLVINALLDRNRNYSLGPHSEIRDQYGMLLLKGIGRVKKEKNRFIFSLIPTDDNLQACSIAKELIQEGEVIASKDPCTVINFASGTIGNNLAEIRVAKQKRPARAEQISDLIEHMRMS